MVKIIIKCKGCGQDCEIKIPFRLRKKVDRIELKCEKCKEICNYIYINKISK